MTTLEELLESRGHKFDKEIHCPCSDWWKGYMTGWHNAYNDIREILEYNGFDTGVIAIPEVSPRNIPKVDTHYLRYLKGEQNA
jgi:hypothetical protein